ncbi:MAG TPA: DUF4340 domain-containing protein [Thermoanaerobaculia bacterium]|nr:DUF4340 domain-containing protein [Thermoanaerobaculia bacterium]
MKPRTLLILLALVVGLGAFIVFYEGDLPSSEERAEQAKRVFAVEADEVTALRLESGGRTVRLTKEPKTEGGPAPGWQLVEPITARADTALVTSLVAALSGLEKSRSLPDYDANELGLSSPRARIAVVTAKGETVLEVGAQLPSSESTIARLAGAREALVVPGSFMADATREAADWRDRTIFRAERSAIQSLAVTRGTGERLLLSRRGEGFWIESPLNDRADREAVDGLLSALTGLKATRFAGLAAVPPEAGLGTPTTVVEVVLTGQEVPWKLALGAPETPGSLSRWARAGGEAFTTDSDLPSRLEKDVASWRSLAWSGLFSWEVEKAEVRDATGTLTLERDGGDWQRNGEKMPYTPVGDFLAAIAEAKAERLLDAPPAGEPVMTVTLEAKEGKKETLSLYPTATEGGTDGAPAGSAERPAAHLLLSPATAADLRAKLDSLRATPALPKEEAKAGEAKVESEKGE